MSYNTFNIADEIKVMNLCQDIVNLEHQIEKARLHIGRLQDQKIEKEVAIDKIREAARARAEVTSLDTGTDPLPTPPPVVP